MKVKIFKIKVPTNDPKDKSKGKQETQVKINDFLRYHENIQIMCITQSECTDNAGFYSGTICVWYEEKNGIPKMATQAQRKEK